MTNTSHEIAPIITINGIPVGDGKPGKITMKLRKLFLEDLAKQSDSHSKGGR
jgi:branched-subunit amino acid aminotransferase/4-amino-4-deoxychorismate lyase